MTGAVADSSASWRALRGAACGRGRRGARRAPRARRGRRADAAREARCALRAALCSRRADLARVRRGVGGVRPTAATSRPLDRLRRPRSVALPRARRARRAAREPAPEPSELAPCPPPGARWSCCASKDFAAYTDAERAAARRLLAPARAARAAARARAARAARRRARAARPTCGATRPRLAAPRRRAARAPLARARPSGRGRLVLVCDVSGSMAPYARMLLQYVQACVAARRRVEAFAFGTRLTRITRELAGRDPDRALRARRRGGRRTGRAARGSARRSADAQPRARPPRRPRRVVVDPLRRLGPRRPRAPGRRDGPPAPHGAPARVAQPARADPRYEPLTRGMEAALPHVPTICWPATPSPRWRSWPTCMEGAM